jgi:hypothetical protein
MLNYINAELSGNLKNYIFNALILACRAEGGDGWSLFVSDKWQQFADDFEKHIKTNDPGYWERNDYLDKNAICFSNHQESIVFSNKEPYDDGYEFIIKY